MTGEAPTFELGPGNCPHQPTMEELHAHGGEWMCPECRFTWIYRPLPYQNLLPRSVMAPADASPYEGHAHGFFDDCTDECPKDPS